MSVTTAGKKTENTNRKIKKISIKKNKKNFLKKKRTERRVWNKLP